MDNSETAQAATPIEAAIEQSVEHAAAAQETTAELAIDIATTAADNAALGDAILAEEIKTCQETSEELAHSLSERILALETAQSQMMETISTLQMLLADCQTSLCSILAHSVKDTEIPQTSLIQKPHTEEKPMEPQENAAEGKLEAPARREKKAPEVQRRKVLWG